MLLSYLVKDSMCFKEGFKTKVKQTKEKKKKRRKKKQCIFSESVMALHVLFPQKKPNQTKQALIFM